MSYPGNWWQPDGDDQQDTAGETFTDHVDVLMGRVHDVDAVTYVLADADTPTGPPQASMLIELKLHGGELGAGLDPAAPQEQLQRTMGRWNLHRVDRFDVIPPTETVTWAVQLDDRPGRVSGVYTKRRDRPRDRWTVITPMPDPAPGWDAMAWLNQGRVAVFVTTTTSGLSWAVGDDLVKGLRAAAAAGDLWGTCAVVV